MIANSRSTTTRSLRTRLIHLPPLYEIEPELLELHNRIKHNASVLTDPPFKKLHQDNPSRPFELRDYPLTVNAYILRQGRLSNAGSKF
jgi:hypothetical protein